MGFNFYSTNNTLKILIIPNYLVSTSVDKDTILERFKKSYPDLHFHIRNSTNLINIGSNKYLGLGHAVLDYKDIRILHCR